MITHTNPDGTPTYTNRLAGETSPYLQHHKHNPVDWYPWGEEAFARARAEDKPIHLSVGYRSCHWCNVLARESFEDEATARIMNESFVNIKVDREERPDIDSIYMTAVQAMTGGGGWPMTVFMTPDGVPFYGGTYFPPEDRYGTPSFRRVLTTLAQAYRSQREELLKAGAELVGRMQAATTAVLSEGRVTPETLDEAYATMHGMFDQTFGGFGRAPKFPQPMAIEFLLRYAARTGQRLPLDMALRTLRAMAEGGMYDQLGGGFHRYSVDEQWLVPHFEKMLYDNALLARTYVEAFQITGDPFFRRVAEETLDYLLREMRDPSGGFYSTQDADSLPQEGGQHAEEGAFYVWSLAEVRELLGPDAMAFAELYDVSERGNFEGSSILHVKRQPAAVARVLGLGEQAVLDLAARSRAKLLAARARRPPPFTDDKILTAWNGMAVRALAAAARALGRDDYRDAAASCADFLLRELRGPGGELVRSWHQGRAGTAPGFLEDHALLADGLLALYEATFDERWLAEAARLAEAIVAGFWDDAVAGFYDTAATHDSLVVRPRDTGDNATPSGNSVAADVLLRLALTLDRPDYRERAEVVIGSLEPLMTRYPTGFGRYLCAAADFVLGRPHEVALVGEPGAPDLEALAEEVFRPFRPGKVVVLRRPSAEPQVASPLLEGRELVGGRAAAYVCRGYVCRLPATDPAALRAELEG